jgi:hypothetical protein
MASPRAALSSTTPTTRARNRPRRSPICRNCARKTVVAISGGNASFFSVGDPENLHARGRCLLSARP